MLLTEERWPPRLREQAPLQRPRERERADFPFLSYRQTLCAGNGNIRQA